MVYLSDVGSGKDRGTSAAGLCARCRHVKVVRSDRGSEFLYCRKAEVDPRYPKYPTLPVLDCPGHEPVSG